MERSTVQSCLAAPVFQITCGSEPFCGTASESSLNFALSADRLSVRARGRPRPIHRLHAHQGQVMTDDEIRNEQLKLLANWGNTLATGILTVGSFIPAANSSMAYCPIPSNPASSGPPQPFAFRSGYPYIWSGSGPWEVSDDHQSANSTQLSPDR